MKLEYPDNFTKKITKKFSFYFDSKAFTLIELLVVIAVIGIISGLVIVTMGDLSAGARDGKRKAEINSLRKAIWMQSSMGSLGYPVQSSWCCIDAGECSTLSSALIPSYLGSFPKDPLYSSANKEHCYMYKSNGTTFDLYTKLEGEGAISLSPESVKISEVQTCDTANGWIDTGLGFCVMQWEARDDGTANCRNNAGAPSFCPVSTGTGFPRASISQLDAIAACKSIGAHLINNAEWMAIARDIESVSSNYVSGVLKRGNVGEAVTGSYNGADPEAGVSNALATLSLSNGQTINHFSGNVWEWVDYTISGADAQPKVPNISAWAWGEINSITDWGNTLSYGMVGPKNTSLNGSTGSGRIYYQTGYSSERAFFRGGNWLGGSSAGAFALSLGSSPSDTGSAVGFRCAR